MAYITHFEGKFFLLVVGVVVVVTIVLVPYTCSSVLGAG